MITGVTRGLGRALVDEFVRLGHTVFCCARTRPEIKELAQRYPDNDFQVVDVAVDKDVQAWAAHVSERHGAPDLVLNNAAIINDRAFLWEVPDRELSDMLNINVGGVCNVVRHFVPYLVRRRRGVIVNFSSRWGQFIEERMAPYCATKWAIVALTRILAAELKPKGVVAVGLNPGVINTPMLRKYLCQNAATTAGNYPSPEEWARSAAPFILNLSMKDSGRVRRILALSPMRSVRRLATHSIKNS